MDYEKPGSFYLGRTHDLATGETSSEPLLYKSKDLTTHAVCVGMTGSGKTGLCLSLLEEAALDGVPAIAIDPKGDLGNLLLTFPGFEPESFRPWIDEHDAERQGQSPDEYAEWTANLWRDGLAKWGQGPERVQRFEDKVERVIYTPGSSAGIPITVLKSFAAPPPEVLQDIDLMRERIQSAASGVLALLGIDADPVQSREHIFLSNVLQKAWEAGRDLSIAQLIRDIQSPPFKEIGVMDVETFYSGKERTKLAMQLNNLLASPSFAGWMQGQPLSVKELLYSAEGKPRLSILSLAHLNDAERMFFVTILLNELLAWTRTQPGTSSLRALLYMDEVFGYFPPVGEPPSKRPMLTLLKQARAYGVGCVLATQNPVDLDYKGLSNCGTWFLGRLQTERDKARVIDGLEGAAVEAGGGFDKRAMEQKLAALGSRVFLMNNVHDDAPTVFHTRWAMSYLRGPLTRGQIKMLMDPLREKYSSTEPASAGGDASAGAEAPASANAAPVTPPAEMATSGRPVLPGDVVERFFAIEAVIPEGSRLEYLPGVLARAKLHYVKASYDVDCWRTIHPLRTIHDEWRDSSWDGAMMLEQSPLLEDEPAADAEFGELPSALAQKSMYKALAKELEEHLYHTQVLKKWRCELLNVYSKVDESEGDFRDRLRLAAHEARDAEIDNIEKEYKKKIDVAQERVDSRELYYDEQNSQVLDNVGSLSWRIIDLVLAVFRGQTLARRSSSSATAARKAAKERGQAQRARAKLDAAIDALNKLEAERDEALQDVRDRFEPENLPLDEVAVTPRRSDINVEEVTLVWLPWSVDAEGRRVPAY